MWPKVDEEIEREKLVAFPEVPAYDYRFTSPTTILMGHDFNKSTFEPLVLKGLQLSKEGVLKRFCNVNYGKRSAGGKVAKI